MSRLKIQKDELRKVFEVFSFLDIARWKYDSNYNLVNWAHETHSNDQKLLVHWLSYVMDRQMDFKRIWEIGGYVISHLVHEYSKKPFKDTGKIVDSFIKIRGQKIQLITSSKVTPINKRLKRYGIDSHPVYFSSRYMPDDIYRIYRTMLILDKTSGRSLIKYLVKAMEGAESQRQAIFRMAMALEQLTYASSSRATVKNLKQKLQSLPTHTRNFSFNWKRKIPISGRKRLWCCFRDLLKSPEFNKYFVGALKDIKYDCPERWSRDRKNLICNLNVLELPGDVWNNSALFRNGLFSPYIENERKSWDMPKIVRNIYDQIKKPDSSFYPEQLDVTFDFVPRMCERDMCDICPFGGGIKQICHRKDGALCSVALACCGYRYKCVPSKCTMKQDFASRLCKKCADEKS